MQPPQRRRLRRGRRGGGDGGDDEKLKRIHSDRVRPHQRLPATRGALAGRGGGHGGGPEREERRARREHVSRGTPRRAHRHQQARQGREPRAVAPRLRLQRQCLVLWPRVALARRGRRGASAPVGSVLAHRSADTTAVNIQHRQRPATERTRKSSVQTQNSQFVDHFSATN